MQPGYESKPLLSILLDYSMLIGHCLEQGRLGRCYWFLITVARLLCQTCQVCRYAANWPGWRAVLKLWVVVNAGKRLIKVYYLFIHWLRRSPCVLRLWQRRILLRVELARAWAYQRALCFIWTLILIMVQVALVFLCVQLQTISTVFEVKFRESALLAGEYKWDILTWKGWLLAIV